MADPTPAEAATAVIARLGAASREIRGCALIGPDGVLACSGGAPAWEAASRSLLDAADRACDGVATHAHVATEEGEVYAVREGALALVAVTSRFTLASLVFADMRAALRTSRVAATPAAEAA